jgi:hypothetical protein
MKKKVIKIAKKMPLPSNDTTDHIAVIKKALAPVFHRTASLKLRLQYAKIMQRYLRNSQSCLEYRNGRLCILDSTTQDPLIVFNKQLGTDSKFGMAYAVTGAKMAKLLKFACKIMSVDEPGHKEEVELLQNVTHIVEQQRCPNLPLTYKIMKCMSKCTANDCPHIARDGRYYVVINELADTDLTHILKKEHDRSTYESILMQIIFSLYSFHGTGFTHNDCHTGNFLIHYVEPGGYLHYKIDDTSVFVPNTGYLVVLWDYGLAEKSNEHKKDYQRALLPFTLHLKRLMNQYVKKGLYVPPEDFRILFAKKIFDCINKKFDIPTILGICKKHATSIIINDSPHQHVLNVKPYTLR